MAAGRSTEELVAEIEELTRSNSERRDAETETRLVALRHAAGVQLLESAAGGADYPEPAFDQLPARNGDLAGITPEQLTPEILRAGILRDGCLLVRGLLSQDDAAGLVRQIHSRLRRPRRAARRASRLTTATTTSS